MPIINTVNILGQGSQGVTGALGAQGIQGIQGIQNFEGIHTIWQTASTSTTWLSYNINGGTMVTSASIGNRMYLMCYTPAKNITYSQLWIQVSSGVVGAVVRILIYNDLNGQPNTKIFESSNLDCTSAGQKIINTTGTFIAGVTYWLCFHGNLNLNVTFFPNINTYPLKYIPIASGYQGISSYTYNANFTEAPQTLINTSIINSTTSPPLIGISRG